MSPPSRTAHPNMLHVCQHRSLKYSGLVILRALPSPCYQDHFKFSRGAGAASELPIPSRGICSGSAQLRLSSARSKPRLRTRRGGIWWPGGGRDTGRLRLDCDTELRKAQPGHAPSLAVHQGAQEQRGHSLALLSSAISLLTFPRQPRVPKPPLVQAVGPAGAPETPAWAVSPPCACCRKLCALSGDSMGRS